MSSRIPTSPQKPKPTCVFFPLGKCLNGDKCSFAHGSQNNDMGPTATTSPSQAKGRQDLGRKTEQPSNVCKYWKTPGKCARGSKCFYSHGQTTRGSPSKKQKPTPSPPEPQPLPPLDEPVEEVEPEPEPEPELEPEVEPEEVPPTQSPGPDYLAPDQKPEEEDAESPPDEGSGQTGGNNDWAETHSNQDERRSVASSPSIDPFSSNQSSAAYSQSSNNRRQSFKSTSRSQTKDSPVSPLALASSPSTQSVPAGAYTPFTPLPSSTSLITQSSQGPTPHWSEYADPHADMNKPFCKFFVQGRCSQGSACVARHSLAIAEYTTLFRETQPPLWHLGAEPPPAPIVSPAQNTAAPVFQPPSIPQSVTAAYPPQVIVQTTSPAQPAPVGTATAPGGLGPCIFWPIGTCRNGDACPYAHVGPAPPAPIEPSTSTQTLTSTQREPPRQDDRQICRTYKQSGYCRNENWCNFSHDLSNSNNSSDWDYPERRSNRRDDNQQGGNNFDNDYSRAQNQPCRWYQAGNCAYGDRCKYAHSMPGGAPDTNKNGSGWNDNKNSSGWNDNKNDQDDNGWGNWVDGWSTEPPPQKEEKQVDDSGWGPEAWEEEPKNDTNNNRGFHEAPTVVANGKKSTHEESSVVDDGWGKDEGGTTAGYDEDVGEPKSASVDNWANEKGSVAEDGWGQADSDHDSMDIPLCENFIKGTCEKGDECGYRHEILSRNLEDGLNSVDREGQRGAHGGEQDIAEQAEDYQFEDVKVSPQRELVDNSFPVDQRDISSIAPESVADTNATDVVEDPNESPPPMYEMPLVEKRMFNSVVQFGANNGCRPTKIRTASESRRVMLYNLPPDVVHDALRQVIDRIAAVDFMDLAFNEGFSTAAVVLLESSQAQDVAVQMDGRDLFGRTIIARLDTTANETIMDPLIRSSVLLSWPAPTRFAWVYFSTVTIAKSEEIRVRGSMFMGRKLETSFYRPRTNQKDSFAVKVTGLPLNADLKSVKELCPKNTNVALGEPTYSDIPKDSILDLLRQTAAIDDVSFLSLSDLTKTRHIAYARLTQGISRVVELHGVAQPFLGKGSISVYQVYHAAYKISDEKFTIINQQFEELKKATKAKEGCSVVAAPAEEGSDHVIHAHSKSEDPTVFHKINQDIQRLIRGHVVMDNDQVVWDEYFDLPSSTKPIEKLNADAPFFIQVDHRLRQIRVWADEAGYKKACHDIRKLLKSVKTRKHVLSLDIPTIGKLVHGDYRTLQRTLGANKLSINVVSRQLTVRGEEETLRQVQEVIGTGDDRLVVSQPLANSGVCVLCYRRPKPSVRLSCNHFYCRPCLRFVIQASNDSDFSPVHCIGTVMGADGFTLVQCPESIPYVLASEILPEADLEQLLRYSLLTHIRQHADTYFFCPSTECETLYQPGRRTALYQCPTCNTSVCSSCRLEYHEGISCEADMAMEVDPSTP